jgi:hypothetical protein
MTKAVGFPGMQQITADKYGGNQTSARIGRKTAGSHGGHYEERRFLGDKIPVCTSQETLRLRYRAQPVNAM